MNSKPDTPPSPRSRRRRRTSSVPRQQCPSECCGKKSVADLMPGDLAYVHNDRDAEAKWLARLVLSHHGEQIKAAWARLAKSESKR